jgi:tetratricopeptide (TPR) repeat protein
MQSVAARIRVRCSIKINAINIEFVHYLRNTGHNEILPGAVETDPLNIIGLENVASVMFINENYEPALEYCNRALAIDDREKNLWLKKVELLRHLGRLEESQQTLDAIDARTQFLYLQVKEAMDRGDWDSAGSRIWNWTYFDPESISSLYIEAQIAYQRYLKNPHPPFLADINRSLKILLKLQPGHTGALELLEKSKQLNTFGYP